MIRSIMALCLLASAAFVPVAAQAHPKVVPGPPPPNLNKTISDLCDQMYSQSGAQQIDTAQQIIADEYGYFGSLSQYDKQCINDAYVIVYG